MAGVVVVNGRFEPGSVVKLLRVKDEAVLRAEGGELVGERVVDGDGVVGWDEVDVGASYFACGYVDGGYLELRCRGVDVSDPNAALTQAPTPAPVPSIGTQGAPNVTLPPEAPAVEEGAEPLPVGLPDGVSLPTLGVKTYYLHNSDSPASPDWHKPDLQAPAETTADGTVLDARPLYEWAGEGEPDLGVGTGEKPEWEPYEGPTEPVGTTPAQSEHTDVSGEPPAEAAPAPEGDPAPPEADVPPASEPVPSESAGTGEQAGAPSKVTPAPESEVTVSAPADVSVQTTPDVPVETVDPSTAPTEGTPAQPDETAPATATDAGGEASVSEPPAQQSQPDASQPEPPVAAPETPAEPAPADPAATEAPAPDQPAPAPEAAPAADAPADGGADTNPPA